SGLENNISGDLLSVDIRNSMEHLSEITGEITNDDVLGNIFSNFCIGK
ncbi:MAG: tRNA uridine-5-carboxymethylaminomethyl(34) synthesis GTPase MnmE, partial [Flavobacteriaceae bacterium]|nr:tRNA uridine-5-carboxymethylaminomethyl(34) synthesis GTPase MnmE [Flavobacteriaceae bacterium]